MFGLLASFFATAVFAQTNAEVILGKWKAEDGKARFEVYKLGNAYGAKITWLLEPTNKKGEAKLDKNNSDKTLRNHPILGLTIAKDLLFNESEKNWKGTIYSPEKGIMANCKITLNSKNELLLKVSKYLMTETKKWTRYE